jgi:hypothetical protein
MSAYVRVSNDGPDDVDILLGGNSIRLLRAGESMALTTALAVSFAPVKPLSTRELAEHSGVPYKDPEPMGRFVEE